jgi:hypothetical protein
VAVPPHTVSQCSRQSRRVASTGECAGGECAAHRQTATTLQLDAAAARPSNAIGTALLPCGKKYPVNLPSFFIRTPIYLHFRYGRYGDFFSVLVANQCPSHRAKRKSVRVLPGRREKCGDDCGPPQCSDSTRNTPIPGSSCRVKMANPSAGSILKPDDIACAFMPSRRQIR